MKKIFKSNRGHEKDQWRLLFVGLFFYYRGTSKENESGRSLNKRFNAHSGR
jgi:hypothetical protein